ncbi:hypothetical protein EJ06DRAFT_547011 [Trichodelitschia bisporula]|uniref:DUF218 domain-containing protein n=1 Tax=Trichodelitschia bisporula TaxID=703511 RepID=A0A6G1I773_9PEZI|nr:hypothetical protein EJ06DRAFT_547011 [Trichodelitschia bisporula]
MAQYATPHTLVIVCCHAVYHGRGSGAESPEDEVSWALASFQKGEQTTFLLHADAALRIARRDPSHTTVIFSGGRTARAYPALSESESYLAAQAAVGSSLANLDVDVETFATDSWQNIVFSLLRFWCVRGAFPHNIVVVTHAFKTERFLKLHRQALRWPTEQFRVLGINPPFNESSLVGALAGEATAYAAWQHDLYGTGTVLRAKRESRGWQQEALEEMWRSYGLEAERQDPIVAERWKLFLTWDGSKVYEGTLPWMQG